MVSNSFLKCAFVILVFLTYNGFPIFFLLAMIMCKTYIVVVIESIIYNVIKFISHFLIFTMDFPIYEILFIASSIITAMGISMFYCYGVHSKDHSDVCNSI